MHSGRPWGGSDVDFRGQDVESGDAIRKSRGTGFAWVWVKRRTAPSFTSVQRDQTGSGTLNRSPANILAVGYWVDASADQ